MQDTNYYIFTAVQVFYGDYTESYETVLQINQEGEMFRDVDELLEEHPSITFQPLPQHLVDIYSFIYNSFGLDELISFDEVAVGAAGDGNIDALLYAWERGATENQYVLLSAVEAGNTDIVRLVIRRGVNVHAKNDEAIRFASMRGYTDIVRLLIDAGDVHVKNDEAIRFASMHGYTDIVRLLINAGANVSYLQESILPGHLYEQCVSTDIWKSPLLLASRYGHADVVRLLLQAEQADYPPLQEALDLASTYGCRDVVYHLINSKAGIKNYLNLNYSLGFASKYGQLDVVELLLEYGAPPTNDETAHLNAEMNMRDVMMYELLGEPYLNTLTDRRRTRARIRSKFRSRYRH